MPCSTWSTECSARGAQDGVAGETVPRSRRRREVGSARARATRAAQKKAEAKKLTCGQYMRRRAGGCDPLAAHLGLLYEDRGLFDLTIGYPTAGLLAVVGAIVLSR